MTDPRRQGHNWEREVINDLRNALPDADFDSSRNASRALDNRGIDVYTSIPVSIQCKKAIERRQSLQICVDSLIRLKNQNEVLPVLLHKMTSKKKGAKRETTLHKFAILLYEDYLELMKLLGKTNKT